MFAEELAIWGLLLVPECWMMMVVGLGVVGLERPLARTVGAGVAMATVTALSRAVIPAGHHVFIIVLAYCALFVFVLRVSLKATLIACFAAFSLLNLGQLLVALPVLRLVGLSVEDTLSSLRLHLAFGWLSDLLLVAGAIYSVIGHARVISVVESGKPREPGLSE